jgi:two-component system, NtrC family, sensor kinase
MGLVDVAQVLRETLALVRYQVERKHVTASLALPQPGAMIQGDDGQLQQVFLNLLQNALDAVPEGGNVHVSARLDTRGIEVAVADTGCGIPEEHLRKIFDPFFSTKGVGKGTGLGLSVSYGIVQAHGGRISAESKTGAGSTFRVWLPAASGKESERAEESA